jgi:hypothetical protein
VDQERSACKQGTPRKFKFFDVTAAETGLDGLQGCYGTKVTATPMQAGMHAPRSPCQRKCARVHTCLHLRCSHEPHVRPSVRI